VLKASGYNALKLKHDEPHSNFAFNFNLRRCIEGYKTQGADGETRIGLSYDKLCTSLVPGNTMLLADGTISIRVDSIESATVVRGTVLNSKKLGERKNCNLPGVKVDIPVLTPKDVDDVQNFCCKNAMDFIVGPGRCPCTKILLVCVTKCLCVMCGGLITCDDCYTG